MKCPECKSVDMIELTDWFGDPMSAYCGGERRWFCSVCDHEYDEGELAKYFEEKPCPKN